MVHTEEGRRVLGVGSWEAGPRLRCRDDPRADGCLEREAGQAAEGQWEGSRDAEQGWACAQLRIMSPHMDMSTRTRSLQESSNIAHLRGGHGGHQIPDRPRGLRKCKWPEKRCLLRAQTLLLPLGLTVCDPGQIACPLWALVHGASLTFLRALCVGIF